MKPYPLIYLHMFWWGLIFHPSGWRSQIVFSPPVRLIAGFEADALTLYLSVKRPALHVCIPFVVQLAFCELHGIDPSFDAPF